MTKSLISDKENTAGTNNTTIMLQNPAFRDEMAKSMIHEILAGRTVESAEKAFYNFPATHWQHLRTTVPIESTFATIRLRTAKARNCYSVDSGLALMHQLAMSAQKRWRGLRGFRQLADVIAGVKLIDGIDDREISRKAAA